MSSESNPYCVRLNLPVPRIEDFVGLREIVWGSSPGWTDPWSRARRVTIVAFDGWSALVEGDGQQWQIGRYGIQAVRPATAIPSPGEPARQSACEPSNPGGL